MINTQYINLNMTPSGVMPVLYCSQYDIGRPLGMVVYNGGEAVDLDGYACTIEATRTDGTAIIAAVTTDDNIGVFETTATMTNQADTYTAKFVIVDGNGKRVASLAFVLCVTAATMDENAESIEEDASLYQQYTGTVQTIIAAIRADLVEEITARQNAVSAEATARQNAITAEANARAAAVSAETAARQSADNTLQSNINAEASARATQDASLQSQIDQFIAPSGEAPSAAEVQNARVGADGVTYPTLGEAIRANDSQLKNHLERTSGNAIGVFMSGYFDIPAVGNAVSATRTASTEAVSALLPVTEGDTIHVQTHGGGSSSAGARGIAWLDNNRKVIERSGINITYTDAIYIVPTSAAYIVVNHKLSGATITPYLYLGKYDREKISDNREKISELMTTTDWKYAHITGGSQIAPSSGNFISASGSVTIYMPCVPGRRYKVTKTPTTRFTVGFCTETPAVGVTYDTTNVVVNHTGGEIEATAPSDAAYLFAYIYNPTYDSNYGTAADIMSSARVYEKSASDLSVRQRISGEIREEIFPLAYITKSSFSPSGEFISSSSRIATQEFYAVGSNDVSYEVGTGYALAVAFYTSADEATFTSLHSWLTGNGHLKNDGAYVRFALRKVNSSLPSILESGNVTIYKENRINNRLNRLETGYLDSVFNVRAYGAVGDGTTNDASAIQSALNDCRTSGGIVYIPDGTYLIGTSLVIYSNTHLILSPGATLLRDANIRCLIHSYCAVDTTGYNGEHDITIEGGTLDLGTGFTQGASNLAFIHAQNITIRNCIMKHMSKGFHFCDIAGCKNVLIENCIFTDALSDEYTACFVQVDCPWGRITYTYDGFADGSACFDSTPCLQYVVRGCTFYLNDYSPAFGNHNDGLNKYIEFSGNYVYGGHSTRGAIAFADYKEHNYTDIIMIHDNVFSGCDYGFKFMDDGTGRAYIHDNVFENIGTLQVNPTSPVGHFSNNVEITTQ